MNFLFLIDPPEDINPLKDTSYIFMEGLQRAGHSCFHCDKNAFTLKDGQLQIHARQLSLTGTDEVFNYEEYETQEVGFFSAVFIRTDPPFDENYLMNTWLLDHVPSHIPVINDPRGVRTVNEKVWVARFPELTPRTLITSQKFEFQSFLQEEKKVVLKPTDGYGGQGVFILEEGGNANVAFETLSNNGSRAVIVQEFLPEASIGDKRVLLLNGEILGAVLRVHGEGDHRNNFFAGGSAVTCDITGAEKQACEYLAPYLLNLGLYFVGLDFIGDKLVEVNVTSPTCLQEMNSLYDLQLQDKVVHFVENLIKEKQEKK